jgi:hypothetical protein
LYQSFMSFDYTLFNTQWMFATGLLVGWTATSLSNVCLKSAPRQELASRVREVLSLRNDVTEKKMFGGLGFMLDGHMAVAAGSSGALMVRADPADINVLPEYGHDVRVVSNLFDGTLRTCDDAHLWLAPFTPGRRNYIYIDLGAPRTLSMLRVWNYNKSRIHSFRGARLLKIRLDAQVTLPWIAADDAALSWIAADDAALSR